jgi:large subunit ribosomal protein L21
MYAIIETGGKQYRVEEGDELDVELLLNSEGTVQFQKVLLVHDGEKSHIGLPHLEKCAVHAEIIGQTKGPKVIAFKYKKCKNSRRTVGHRQKYSRVKITKIIAA